MLPVSPARLAAPQVTTPQSANTFDVALHPPQNAVSFTKTGIDSLDKKLAATAKLPARPFVMSEDLAPDFPQGGTALTWPPKPDEKVPTVTMVGLGWYSVHPLGALVASGVHVEAIEQSPAKIGRGQIGLSGGSDSFSYGNARFQSQLMPSFSKEQLEKLPPVISQIQELPHYKALQKKRSDILFPGSSRSEADNKYNALPDSQKITKSDTIEAKKEIIDFLKNEGYLTIIPEEATIDSISKKLENKEPVFLVTGEQVVLSRMGMEGLEGKPGFVKEFLLDNSETGTADTAPTSKALEILKGLQQTAREHANRQGISEDKIPEEYIPHVALVGGGPIAIGSFLDIAEHINPDLLKVSWIQPPEKAGLREMDAHVRDKARSNLDFKQTVGLISDIEFSKDAIASLSIKNANTVSEDKVKTDLLLHSSDELWYGTGTDIEPYKQAISEVSKQLEEKRPENAISRLQAINDIRDEHHIASRITEPLTITLEDDNVLKQKINQLVKRQNSGEQTTFVLNGNNFMTDSATVLADQLNYRGKVIQIAPPVPKEEREEHADFDSKKAATKIWSDVRGRSVAQGTTFKDNKFSLGIKRQDGQHNTITGIDVLINAAGKTQKTPLIQAMIDKGYIGINPEGSDFQGLFSNHDKLDGFHNFFVPRDTFDEEETFPSTVMPPLENLRFPKPSGWEEAFEFGRDMRAAAQSKKE